MNKNLFKLHPPIKKTFFSFEKKISGKNFNLFLKLNQNHSCIDKKFFSSQILNGLKIKSCTIKQSKNINKELVRYYPAWDELRNNEKRKLISRVLLVSAVLAILIMGINVESVATEKIFFDEEKKLLQYEGGMKEGKYHAKGTLYYPNGNVQYKGEFRDGKRNGVGISYDVEGKEEYKGRWENDRKMF